MNVGHPIGFLAVLAVLGVVVFLCAFGWAVIAADALRSGSPLPGGAPAPTSPGEANPSSFSAAADHAPLHRVAAELGPGSPPSAKAPAREIDYLRAVPIYDPRAVGGYRHAYACAMPEYPCDCGMDGALLDAERIAMEAERG